MLGGTTPVGNITLTFVLLFFTFSVVLAGVIWLAIRARRTQDKAGEG